ncbi:hypothetical protein [Streptomyces griseosporeus]|uniref:hypothetical protein n=1 Tax=Streptomyces griseosporeus TaxID=1910 RepID=UPI00167CEE67|nr:hypothetical protein [Streptomyces griseosporeus]GHF75815.1 hypothetical protein GCM10018783_52270 [Streptomyces griseosporeus]
MGIDLELHSARPAHRNWRKSRATLLRSSYEHGDALAELLGSFRQLGVAGRLAGVDPYGDTLMNEQEAAAALREIQEVRDIPEFRDANGLRRLDALDALAGMLEQCAGTPGSYVWFAGD